MLKEQDKLAITALKRSEQIQYCKDVIKAAGRYERLLVDSDFKEVLADLTRLAGIHKQQIDGWLSQLEGCINDDEAQENPVQKHLRIFELIKVHQCRMNQLHEAIKYPQQLIQTANEARTTLHKLLKEDKEDAPSS